MTPANDLARLVQALRQQPEGSMGRLALQTCVPDADAALRWLQEAQERAGAVIVFRQSAPGYLDIGPEGASLLYPDPNLAGLWEAWTIFLNIPTGHDSLLYPTDTGLRNALARAADWANPRCRELANAIRAIKVQRDPRGSGGAVPRFEPARPVRFVLM